MLTIDQLQRLIADVQNNCNISDARDHGIYTMCTMVLKLRNLYKWEKGIQPWNEPEPAELLDWIECKENYWETISTAEFSPVSVNGKSFQPEDSVGINSAIKDERLHYGCGFGRSLKSVFFLAQVKEVRTIGKVPVVILGKEMATDMAFPFAMAQENVVYIRKEPLRFFLWDQIQELRGSCRVPLHHALGLYGLLTKGKLDQHKFRKRLDTLVDQELDLFIYHEIGELLQKGFSDGQQRKLIALFPGSAIEHVCRSIKDILADTDPHGPVARCIATQRESSLSFYVGFLDGLRKKFFPEIVSSWERFRGTGDWQIVEDARKACYSRYSSYAELITEIADKSDGCSREQTQRIFYEKVMLPLGIEVPQQQASP